MILTEQIALLQQQLAAAQQQAQANFASLTAAQTELATAREGIATLTTERDEARGQLATVTTERDQARTDLQAEKDSRETKIGTEVTARLAAAGGDPIKRDPAATAPGDPGASSSLGGMKKATAYFADRQPKATAPVAAAN